MTTLALDFFVPGVTDRLGIFFMTFGAAFPPLVFNRELLPFIDIAQSIEIVGKGIAMYAEIIGNHEMPGNHHKDDQAHGKP